MARNTPGITFQNYVRSYLAIILFFLLLLFFTPIIVVGLLITFGRFSNFVIEKIAPFIANTTLRVIGITFTTQLHTDELPSPAVYIINHSSTLDMLTILALGLPRVRFVAKWEFQYNPIFFLLGRSTGQVFIRRQKSDKAIQTLKKNVARIHRQNLSLLMAPEGSRKHPGIIGPFKKGPFRMAMDLEYPIVPIFFEGNRRLNSGKSVVAKRGTCTAHIHPPIDTSTWDTDNLDKPISDIRNMYLQWAEQAEQE